MSGTTKVRVFMSANSQGSNARPKVFRGHPEGIKCWVPPTADPMSSSNYDSKPTVIRPLEVEVVKTS